MPYLDGGAEVGGDLPAVALDARSDVARNPDELQLTGGVVDAVDPGLRGQGVLVDQGLGGLLRDGHGGRLGELLEGRYGEWAGGAAAAEREAKGIGGRRRAGRCGEEREGEAERNSSGGGGSHGDRGMVRRWGVVVCFASAASGGLVVVLCQSDRIGSDVGFFSAHNNRSVSAVRRLLASKWWPVLNFCFFFSSCVRKRELGILFLLRITRCFV